MSAIIGRRYSAERVVIAINTAVPAVGAANGRNNGWIDARDAAGGLLRTPAAWTTADITFQVLGALGSRGASPTKAMPTDETPKSLYDKIGTLVRITNVVADGWFEIPAQVLMAGFFRIRSTNTASAADVDQAAARELWIALKS